MKKKFRKPSPSPPHWYWTDSDYCWPCKNRNGCRNCKILKEVREKENKKRERKKKQKFKMDADGWNN